MTVIGSRSTNASLATSTTAGAAPSSVRRAPSAPEPNFFRVSSSSSAIRSQRSFSSFSSAWISLRSFASALCSLRISISSSRRSERSRMFRIASACVSVSLKRSISRGFGSSSLRMIRITSSTLR